MHGKLPTKEFASLCESYDAATGVLAGTSKLGGVQIVCLNWVAGFMAYILMNQSRISTPCMCTQCESFALSERPGTAAQRGSV